MTTELSHFRRYRGLYALGIAAITTLTVAHFTVERFDWPSWIQAVGSIAAILVAVWVSADQAQQQRQREMAQAEAEIEGVLRTLKAEVETSLEYIEREIAPIFDRIKPGSPITYAIRMPEYPFPIFDGLIPKLGTIPSPALQRQIIHAFGQAKGAAITLQVHSDLADEFDRVQIRYDARPALANDAERVGARNALIRYGDTLRAAFDRTLTDFRALHRALAEVCPNE